MAHVIDYIEFAVDDLEQSKRLLREGAWMDLQRLRPGLRRHQGPENRGEFGGLNPQPVTSRGEGVLALIRRDDADAALASVVEAGGQVGLAIHDYPGGRRCSRRLNPYLNPYGSCLLRLMGLMEALRERG